MVESRKKERKFIEGVIKHLRKSDERSVIRVRYIDNESWDGVVDVLFGAREDLLEKADIYMRRVYKLHGEALLSMAKYIEESGLVWKTQTILKQSRREETGCSPASSLLHEWE